MFCINEYQSASAYLGSNKWGQKRKRPTRKARHAGYLIPSNRTGPSRFEGRLALNPELNLTRVSFSCVQMHFLG